MAKLRETSVQNSLNIEAKPEYTQFSFCGDDFILDGVYSDPVDIIENISSIIGFKSSRYTNNEWYMRSRGGNLGECSENEYCIFPDSNNLAIVTHNGTCDIDLGDEDQLVAQITIDNVDSDYISLVSTNKIISDATLSIESDKDVNISADNDFNIDASNINVHSDSIRLNSDSKTVELNVVEDEVLSGLSIDSDVIMSSLNLRGSDGTVVTLGVEEDASLSIDSALKIEKGNIRLKDGTVNITNSGIELSKDSLSNSQSNNYSSTVQGMNINNNSAITINNTNTLSKDNLYRSVEVLGATKTGNYFIDSSQSWPDVTYNWELEISDNYGNKGSVDITVYLAYIAYSGGGSIIVDPR